MYEILNRIISFNGARLYFRDSLSWSWWILGTLNGGIGLSIETYYCCVTGKYEISVSQWLNSPFCAEYLRKGTFCLYHASIIKWHIVLLCPRGMGFLRAKPKITVICFVSTPKHYRTNILSTQYDGFNERCFTSNSYIELFQNGVQVTCFATAIRC